MQRVSVDIGGTFTDCFLVWGDDYVSAKALTTHQNLALGFNAALGQAFEQVGVSLEEVMREVDSVRYATTLGTNALIERRGPAVGLITTAGFESSIPLSRGRGYGEGLPDRYRKDLPMAERPAPIVPIPMIAGVRERMSERGEVIMALDEDDVRAQVRTLVDRGAQAFVVSLVNSVVNPAHELRVEELIRSEYPEHMLGSAPIILAHLVAGRKGEYARTSSAILDAFLHKAMYLGLSTLELNLRENGHERPMQVVHNSGGMAQLNSTDALQTIHSGPVAGIGASEHLAAETDLGNIVCSDMGGTSFDIGLVVEGGVKFYDFNPVIDRWMVNIPMVHLVTLGAGGGSIARYDRLRRTVAVGPDSAGSDPGPACYDKGGREATVTDADLLLGYLEPDNYAGGRIALSEKRAAAMFKRNVAKPLGIDEIAAAKLVKQKIDHDMANGIAQELRARGYEPSQFTLLAYGGNGALHACGIANAIGIEKVLVPPFSSIFSAVGAGNMDQLHIHERSLYLQIYDSVTRALLDDFDAFNAIVEGLEARGRADLQRQGYADADIEHRLELDMRYGNQLAQTAVVVGRNRITSSAELLELIELFGRDYGKRFGEGSQAPEAGIRVNTIRVASYVRTPKLQFKKVLPAADRLRPAPEPVERRACHFVDHEEPVETGFYRLEDLEPAMLVAGPAVVVSESMTFLVEPGWRLAIGDYGAGWLERLDTNSGERP
ncbi:MAG: hydantoinase/oxoprolinase family protein [Parasphingopyxis sp.]|uniref:hydantoinase/oxoprolinase family protein n=1 Tax=Parasphingopyxis sp. TaxID=1920299 RepID=UPI003FA0F98A